MKTIVLGPGTVYIDGTKISAAAWLTMKINDVPLADVMVDHLATSTTMDREQSKAWVEKIRQLQAYEDAQRDVEQIKKTFGNLYDRMQQSLHREQLEHKRKRPAWKTPYGPQRR